MGEREQWTIDELARRAGTTTRTVRNYQTLGLLPPPALVGRVGHYDEGHLGRLRLISRLQEQGFSLAGIAELVRAWEQGRSLADLLGFEQALTAPWSDEQPEEMSAQELMRLFPEVATDPQLALRAVELGLVEPAEDHFRVPSPRLLRVGAEMTAAGIPLAVAQEQLAALRADMEQVAARFVDLFDRHVWQPFAEAGMPSERLPDVTESLRRLRPLAKEAVDAVLAQAMDRRTAASTAGRAIAVTPAETQEEAG
ncbi:MAG TPA: MerR family transcriptional regulator [Acidimicrobiales bacterium]|nr:MerR family transcriptional regulator [Acidimicrobiales bacterium]